MKYKLIIFDWDGTLMDSTDKIVASMHYAADYAGLPMPSERDVRNIIGLSMPKALQVLFGQLSETQLQRLAEYYKYEYQKRDTQPCALYPGAIDLLQQLSCQNRLLAVATGKQRAGLQRVWQSSQTGHYFHASRCADEAESKPSPDMLAQILGELRLSAKEAVMIGDTSFDMAMAEALGMDRIALTHGAHLLEQLVPHNPLAVVDSLPELLPLL